MTNNIFNFILELARIIVPSKVSAAGKSFLFYGALFIGGGAYFTITYDATKKVYSLGLYNGNPDIITYSIGVIFLIAGAVILVTSHKKTMSERSLMYFANTLKQGDSKAPTYAMEKDDRIIAPIVKHLKRINSYNKKEVIKNYGTNLELFEERVEHKDINKIYIAALGSNPYLYLLGTLIRNGHTQNIVLDYNRDNEKWYALASVGDKLTHSLMYEPSDKTIENKLDELCNNNSEAIGIALAYTFPINKTSVPQELRDNTIYLTHPLGFGNDKLSNMASQASLLNELTVYIDKLRSADKKVHLFISAQASLCIKLGKRYQDNTMGEIYIHNYNGAENVKAYDWYIAFNKGEVS